MSDRIREVAERANVPEVFVRQLVAAGDQKFLPEAPHPMPYLAFCGLWRPCGRFGVSGGVLGCLGAYRGFQRPNVSSSRGE